MSGPGHSAQPVALVTSPEYLLHQTPPLHPESPGRLEAVWGELDRQGLRARLRAIPPRPATASELALAHSPDYVELARREIESGRPVLSTGDTEVCRRSFDVALLAAGAGLAAVDAVCEGAVRAAFCPVRPPGHHATPSVGMGFCIFNNAAVAARYAQRAHGVGRVLIADWDLHHGNGTQSIFYEDPSVFYFSIHQLDNYPMPLTGKGYPDETGTGAGTGTNLNCPLPAGAGDAEFLDAIATKLAPAMRRFRPELVIVSAGFDCRAGDPLGELTVSDDGFARMTRALTVIADAYAGGRIISLLEGGYSLPGLASAAAAHVRALLG